MISSISVTATIEMTEQQQPEDRASLQTGKQQDYREDQHDDDEKQQLKTKDDTEAVGSGQTTITSYETGGQFSDQQSVDEECERLLRNVKRQVKQMMEEAVTRKFVHEESSSIIALCVAIDACLSHGLKRRALGLFKTNSSSALIQKVAKSCPGAQDILDLVEDEQKQRQLEEQQQQQQQQQRKQSLVNQSESSQSLAKGTNNRSPVKQVASNHSVCKRNMWIKCALIEKKLVMIVEYLAENANKYYEPAALMSNRLSAEILSSLLVGPCALEFSRSKTSDFYQFEEPSADELLKRHKLSNPIACLCNQRAHLPAGGGATRSPRAVAQAAGLDQRHSQLARSATDNNCLPQSGGTGGGHPSGAPVATSGSPHCHRNRRATTSQASLATFSSALSAAANSKEDSKQQQQRPETPPDPVLSRTGSRRRPLALKTNLKSGALVTECHHYCCQEISEHQQPTKGYSFKCDSSNGFSAGSLNHSTTTMSALATTTSAPINPISPGSVSLGAAGTASQMHNQQQQQWSVWSPIMLHETLHQNSKSNLLYAKNNVLMETQPGERMAGYLSLHQTSSDLLLKWIPNQMINGQANGCSSLPPSDYSSEEAHCSESHKSPSPSSSSSSPLTKSSDSTTKRSGRSKSEDACPTNKASDCNNNLQSKPVGSNYLDLIVSLSVSRIVLLQCHFNSSPVNNNNNNNNHDEKCAEDEPTKGHRKRKVDGDTKNERDLTLEETLILVETDGVQRAPFKFPKGGLRWFLSCLESGLRPHKVLDPAIKPDEAEAPWPDPLQEESVSASSGGDLWTPAASRLGTILKRLPSLKRRQVNSTEPAEPSEVAAAAKSSRSSSPSDEPNAWGTLPPVRMPINYVYRIVSVQQSDCWAQPTPPLSAISFGSSTTSGSFGTLLRQSFHSHNGVSLTTATSQGDNASNNDQTDSTSARGQKFRWSLSRLTRFRYYKDTPSVSSTSSSINLNHNNYNGKHTTDTGSLNESNDVTNNSLDQTGSLDGLNNQHMLMKRDSSAEFARIEAKLKDLNKSSTEELIALRDQSIQTLCESMRKQILARAFYGWLAHCRRSKIIKTHLVKLIKRPDGDNGQGHSTINDHHEEYLDLPYETLKLGLTKEIWNSLMDSNGEENKSSELQLKRHINQLVFYGGIESNELRVQVWPYLLRHYSFIDSQEERRRKDAAARESYLTCGREWIKIERVVKQRDNEILAANMAKVARRNQRAAAAAAAAAGKSPSEASHQQASEAAKRTRGSRTFSETSDDLYLVDESNKGGDVVDNEDDEDDDDNERDDKKLEEDMVDKKPTKQLDGGSLHSKDEQNQQVDLTKDQQQQQQQSSSKQTVNRATNLKSKRRRRRVRLESTGSVGSDASITDQFGNNVHRIDKDVQRCDRSYWYFKNVDNLDKLRNIMCSYVWQHLDVGYVQGMCDLAAPFLVIFDDEIQAYTCFSQLMKRMVANFPHGSAMDQHFESLKYLMQVLDPKLFEILQDNGDYTHFYFCYRWLLLDFKRELAYEDVFRVWETIWSAQFVATDHFVVFMALAMVRYYRDIIIENNMDFTDTIKFFNEMAERHDAIKILALARDCITELETLINDCGQYHQFV